MSARELTARVRRFIPLATRSLLRDLQLEGRSLRESARRVGQGVRGAWRRSDPVGWRERMDALFAPRPEFLAAAEREKQRLAQARERFVSEGASFSGTLHARGIFRGMILDDGNSEQDLDDWLSDQLGLDAIHGDQLDVRIVIEALKHPTHRTRGRDE